MVNTAFIQALAAETAKDGGKIFTFTSIIKFGLLCLLVMALIYVLAVLTPKIAAAIDKYLQKHRTSSSDDRTSEVRSIYDSPQKNSDDDNSKSNG
jgi:hypothetical protein